MGKIVQKSQFGVPGFCICQDCVKQYFRRCSSMPEVSKLHPGSVPEVGPEVRTASAGRPAQPVEYLQEVSVTPGSTPKQAAAPSTAPPAQLH